jgi:hypothetical protein
MLNDTIQIVQVVVAVVGGIFIAWYWNERNHLLSEYKYLDEIYWKLLDAYVLKPEFGDKRLTENYRESFRDKDALSYYYFAMRAHTVMETIYDVYRAKIPEEWIHIFNYHTALHSRWLRDNQSANERSYVKRVLTASAL